MSLKAPLAGVFGPGKAPAPEGAAPDAGAPRARPRKGVPPAAAAAVYRPARSFIDHLPWAEALGDGTILLEDGRSAGAAWEIEPRGTEGRSGAWLTELRDALHDALQDSLEERDASPWVVQTYTWREPDLTAAAEAFAGYVSERARGSAFSDAYADLLAAHYRGVAKPGGLFADRLSQTRWAGARQRTVVVVHRWVREARGSGGDAAPPGAAVLEAGGKLMAALEGLGVCQRRLSGAEFHAWLTRWFNAWTDLTPDDPGAFARTFLDDGAIPYGDGFAESLFYAHPRSDAANGCWHFDRTAMRVLGVEGLRRAPAIGHVTGETRHGDAVNAVLDELPEGTVYATTLVPGAAGHRGCARRPHRGRRDRRVGRRDARARRLPHREGDHGRAPQALSPVRRVLPARPLGRGLGPPRRRGPHRAAPPRVPGHRPGGRLARARRVPRAPADGLRPGRRPAGGLAPRAPRLGAARGERVARLRALAGHRAPGLVVLQPGRGAACLRSAEQARPAQERARAPGRPDRGGQERNARGDARAAHGGAPPAALRHRGRQLLRPARRLVRVAGLERQPGGA